MVHPVGTSRTAAEIVLPLALREKPCRWCRLVDGHWVDSQGFKCTTCNGTSQVPEFPMLREPCPGYNLLGVCEAQEEMTGKSMRKIGVSGIRELTKTERQQLARDCGGGCQGRGWLLVITVDALLEAGKPYGITLWWDRHDELWRAYSPDLSPSKSAHYYSENKQMALALALVAAHGSH